MAILDLGTQYRYTSRGPLDAKATVKTFDDLIATSTWTVGSTITAYNGMLTAVWLDKQPDQSGKQVLSDKNGIYILFDASITSALKAPDVTNPANWHKLCELADLEAFTADLADLKARVEALQAEEDILTFFSFADFPDVGQSGKLYVDTEKAISYVWFNNQYLAVSSTATEMPTVINGGSAD